MTDQGKSYPSNKSILERKSQGEMVAEEEDEWGGVKEEDLLEPQKRTAPSAKPRRKAA